MAENVKLEFGVEQEDGTLKVETPWAISLGNDLYQLDNIPFYAYGISLSDIVQARKESNDGFPVFVKVAKKSGNRTIRVIFDLPVEENNTSRETLHQLTVMGCTYEGANKSFVCINIPPEADLLEIRTFLDEHQLFWEQADPVEEDLYPDEFAIIAYDGTDSNAMERRMAARPPTSP